MSSVCSCGLGREPDYFKIRGPHTARKIATSKAGRVKRCPNCGVIVQVGERCVDCIGSSDGDGFFFRFHQACFDLMDLFGERMCGGDWSFPFNLDEAAEHAIANGDDPFWRDWLLLYEQTWAWRPEPPGVDGEVKP